MVGDYRVAVATERGSHHSILTGMYISDKGVVEELNI